MLRPLRIQRISSIGGPGRSNRGLRPGGSAVAAWIGLLLSLGIATGRVPGDYDFALLRGPHDFADLYRSELTGYAYPPPLAQLMQALSWIPTSVLVFAWHAALFGVLAWLGGWLAVVVIVVGCLHLFDLWSAPIIGTYVGQIAAYALIGNIQFFLVGVSVAGLRHPSLWALALLTKVGPGIGLVWHVARRQWRPVAMTLVATTVVAGISFALAPQAWVEWITVAGGYGSDAPLPMHPVPFVIRLPLSAALVVFAASTHRPWIVPLACGYASPALYEWSWLPFLLGTWKLSELEERVTGSLTGARVRAISLWRAVPG